MEIELTGNQVSAGGPQTDGALIVRKFQFLLREERPALGCAPIEAELTLKFSTSPGQVVPTHELSSCKAVLSLPVAMPVASTMKIKILRDITLETRKVENEALHGPATIPLREGAICELTKPPVQSTDNPKKYALVFLPFTRGCLDLFEGVDFEFV